MIEIPSWWTKAFWESYLIKVETDLKVRKIPAEAISIFMEALREVLEDRGLYHQTTNPNLL